MNLKLHKELYFFEWNRKEQLALSANLPVGLLTVIAGGILFLVQSFPYGSDLASIVFLLFASSSTIFLIAGIYFLIRSLHGYWYEQIPPPDRLQAYFDELNQYHAALKHASEEAQQDFDEYLQKRLAEAAAVNRANNTRTAGALHNTTRSIIFAVVFSGLSFVPYLAKSLDLPPKTATVRIKGPVIFQSEAHMHNSNEQDQSGQSQQQPQPQQPESEPPKPQGPPNEQVRKDGETREKR